MSEGGAPSSNAGFISMFIPNPSLRPVKYWQGIVDMIGRGVLLVLLLVMFGTSSSAQDDTQDIEDSREYSNAAAAAGFSIVVGVVAFVYEITFIVCRFLNFTFMIAARTIVLSVDMGIHLVSALLLFAAAVSMAYYADFTKDLADLEDQTDASRRALNRIGDSLGAGAFFAFMSLFGMIFVAIWAVLFLIFKWDLGGGSSSKE